MGFLDWLFGPREATEAAAPPPRKPAPDIDAIGFNGEIDPLAKSDRKNPAVVVAASLRSAQERNRKTRYDQFDAMDSGDIAAMLDAVVGAALTFDDVGSGRGFKVECDNASAAKVLKEALEATRLADVVEEVARDMLKYGDAFVEPIFDGKDLVGVQTYKPSEIFRSQDDKGRLIRGKDDAGFPAAFQQKRRGQVVAGWQPWELTHFRFWPEKKLIYSKKGILDDIRAEWRKLQLVEIGMVTARVTRAYPRRIHYVDMTGKDRTDQERSLAAYIARMTNRVFGQRNVNEDNLPVADVGEDLYVATGYTTDATGKSIEKLNRVETEDPAIAGIAELDDVSYLRQKLWCYVPSDVVGIKRNTSGDLDSQDLAYARLLRRTQRQLELGIRQILDQALMARGRMKIEYRVVFPVVTVGAAWKHSDARFRDSMTLRNYLEMDVIPRRYALKRSFNLSDLEVDELWEQIKEERESGLFVSVLPFRNGQPGDPSAQTNNPDANPLAPDNEKPKGPQAKLNTAKKKGKHGSLPTAGTGVAAALDPKKAKAVTNNGIYRGTKLSMITRGNSSGG